MNGDAFTYNQFLISDQRHTVAFSYTIHRGDINYQLTETLKFPVALKQTKEQLAGLRALHIALGISYYKIFVSPVIVHPYQMDKAEAAFWNDVWLHGLGEFLYVNQLSPDALARFSDQTRSFITEPEATDIPKVAAILGIGGGKDSVVAGELLKRIGVTVDGFVMATGEQLGQAKAIAETMGIGLQVVERSLDTQLLELQELPGAYKGHIPISLIFGLVGATLATALNSQYVVVANEASASIPRVVWEHGEVNHQWSKSFDFERQLQAFIKQRVCPDITYFSAIRQLTSVGVAKLFAGYPQFFETFTSDNFVFRMDPDHRPNSRWSLESPKSLSSFILLAPWLGEADMLRTFGKNFLDQASLESLFKELVGIEGQPPLDCVGTVEELILSLNLAADQGKYTDSYLMNVGRSHGVIRQGHWNTELASMLSLQPDQALPIGLRDKISAQLAEGLSA